MSSFGCILYKTICLIKTTYYTQQLVSTSLGFCARDAMECTSQSIVTKSDTPLKATSDSSGACEEKDDHNEESM